MTFVDVLYRYELHPTEASMFALGAIKEVYGVRQVVIDEGRSTIRVEFDATRLNRSTIAQLLRRAGFSVLEELSLMPEAKPEMAPDASAAAQPAK